MARKKDTDYAAVSARLRVLENRLLTRERMEQLMRVPYTAAPLHRARQSAAAIAALGRLYYEQGRMVEGAAFVPEYLRLSQAERERKEKERGEPL